MESSSPPSSTPLPIFNLVASIVSTVNLHCDGPFTLLQALATSHPADHEIRLQSYYKEKGGIKRLGLFCWISIGEYWALHKKGAPKAIPTITIKKDEQLVYLWAISCIVVLVNWEDRE